MVTPGSLILVGVLLAPSPATEFPSPAPRPGLNAVAGGGPEFRVRANFLVKQSAAEPSRTARRDSRPRSDPDRDSLAGRWLLTMPRGFEYDATLEPGEEPGLYRLHCGALNLQGVYELRDRRLKLVSSNQPKMVGITWEVRNANALELTVHPKTANVGADYRGATLGRQKRAVADGR